LAKCEVVALHHDRRVSGGGEGFSAKGKPSLSRARKARRDKTDKSTRHTGTDGHTDTLTRHRAPAEKRCGDQERPKGKPKRKLGRGQDDEDEEEHENEYTTW
jgi:hypothetical protein